MYNTFKLDLLKQSTYVIHHPISYSIPSCEKGDLWQFSGLHCPEPPPYSGSTTEVYIQGFSGQVLELQLHLKQQKACLTVTKLDLELCKATILWAIAYSIKQI